MKLKRKNCLICDKVTSKHMTICEYCYSILDPKVERVMREFSYVDEAYSCFYYNQILRETITRYKFGNKRYFAHLFSELLIEKIFEKKLHKEIDFLVPVPLHRETYIKRGFNQIELIIEEINKLIKIPISSNNLVKDRNTKEQARLDEVERKSNLRDAFSLRNSDEIEGKSILLVDDMITTGSTVEECAKVLKKARANKVTVLSIATSQ